MVLGEEEGVEVEEEEEEELELELDVFFFDLGTRIFIVVVSGGGVHGVNTPVDTTV